MCEVTEFHGRGTKVRAERDLNTGRLRQGQIYTIHHRRNGWVYLEGDEGSGWAGVSLEH